MKFILFVEGETEEKGVAAFLKRGLDPYFTTEVGIKTAGFSGWSDLHDEAPKKAALYLTDPAYSDVIAVVSLLDLYGPTFYPKDQTSVRDRNKWGQEYMEGRVRQHFHTNGLDSELHKKYRHFFAVHETEAWLVAQPSLFRTEIRKPLEDLNKKPEEINFTSPPAKLLDKLHLQKFNRHYNKTTNARNFFPKLSIDSVAETCPYLKVMLLELKEMAIAAGVELRNQI